MRWLRITVPILLVLSLFFIAPHARGAEVVEVDVLTNNFLNNSTAKADAALLFDTGPIPNPNQVDNVTYDWYDPDGLLACSNSWDPNVQAVARGYCHVAKLGMWNVTVFYEGNMSITDNTTFEVVPDHWGPGTYIVNWTTFVSEDATLTIEPGTTIAFDDNKSLGVEGKLIAQGNETHPIVFTSNKSVKSPGDWNTIVFYNKSDPLSVIDHIKVEYSRYGLTLEETSPTVTNSTFENNTLRAIYAEYSFSLIKNNTISWYGAENLSPGIYLAFSNVTLEGNFIEKVSKGLEMFYSNVTMRDNFVTNCYSYGMNAKGSIVNSTNDSMIENKYGVKLEFESNGTFEGLKVIGQMEGFITHDDSKAILWNSTVELVQTATFYLARSSSVILVNCSFWKIGFTPGVVIGPTDDSILIIKNFLTVEVISHENYTHLANATVEVSDGETLVHNTTTAADGFTLPLVVTDRTYMPTLIDNTTKVHVALWNLSFEDNNRNVQMGSGHTETFWGSVFDLDGDGEPDFSDEDLDGDGLSNETEIGTGTNPRDPDTDDDGIPDGYEFDSDILDPSDDSDALLDYDGDGLSNLGEYLNGTLPDYADTDADGLDDFMELGCGMNPLNTSDAADDWDGDGFSNGKECRAGTDLLDPDDKPPEPGPDLLTIIIIVVLVVVVAVVAVLLVRRRLRKPPVAEEAPAKAGEEEATKAIPEKEEKAPKSPAEEKSD